MKLENLQKKLIAAARAETPSDRVPYAFEKRIMARLAGAAVAPFDLLGAWSAALWRAAVSCLALTLLAGAVTLWSSYRDSQADFAQEFDKAVYASIDSTDDAR